MIHVFFTNKEVWVEHDRYVKSKVRQLEEKKLAKMTRIGNSVLNRFN